MTRVISHVVHPDLGDYSLEADELGGVTLYHTLDPDQPERRTRMDLPLAVLFALTQGTIDRLNIKTVHQAHRYDVALRRPANVKVIPIQAASHVVAIPHEGFVA